MAYFKVDARSYKSEAAEEEEILASESGETVVGSRPNLVASFPPHVRLRLREEKSWSRSTRRICTSSMRLPVRRCASAASPRRRSPSRSPGARAPARCCASVRCRVRKRCPRRRRSRRSRPQRIYFVMPDRYADGDPSNDTRRPDRTRATLRASTRLGSRPTTTAAT